MMREFAEGLAFAVLCGVLSGIGAYIIFGLIFS